MGYFSNTTTSNQPQTTSGYFSQATPESNPNKSGIQLEGNLIGNAMDNVRAIGAGITTMALGVIGADKASRESLVQFANLAKEHPGEAGKEFINGLLSTYDLTMDDFGKMPLGEIVEHTIEGAWKHPVDAYLDVASVASIGKHMLPKHIKDKLPGVAEADTITKATEKALRRTEQTADLGQEFVRRVEDIERSFDPTTISKAMEAIETVGFRNAPRELLPAMQKLTQANDVYKTFLGKYGVELVDDVEFATKELLAKQYKVPIAKMDASFMKSDFAKEAMKYVVDNDVKPLFHLSPKIIKMEQMEEVTSNLYKRKFGTIDYNDAVIGMSDKAAEYVDKIVKSDIAKVPNKVNEILETYNKTNGTSFKPLPTWRDGIKLPKALREANSELKKVMLSPGTYLGQNVLALGATILNNFSIDGIRGLLGDIPKFRWVKLDAAETPILHAISRVNNLFYRPAASVDKYLEEIGRRYIKHAGIDRNLMQSAIPTQAIVTNPALKLLRDLVPFGSYPVAALQEVLAHIESKPLKSLIYNQINKSGQQANIKAQEIQYDKVIDPTQAVRHNEEYDKDETINFNVTPIQGAATFLGLTEDAIQIPIKKYIERMMRGVQNPNEFEIGGKTYQMNQGILIREDGAQMNIMPAIAFTARSFLAPETIYNNVINPMITGKTVRDEASFVDHLVTDAGYSNMSSQAQKKVTTETRKKLGMKVLGTYQYNYYNPDDYRMSKRDMKKLIKTKNLRREIKANTVRIQDVLK